MKKINGMLYNFPIPAPKGYIGYVISNIISMKDEEKKSLT